MSDLVTDPTVSVCAAQASGGPVRELLPSRTVPLGESTVVRRLLPSLGRRMIGTWCFLDHYGPDDVAGEPGMQVAPHPHTGLQTVSWLIHGEVHHRDSLGSDLRIRPGELALMTAGHGIAHSEQSPPEHPPVLHGAQLWIALPDADRNTAPRFESHPGLPVLAGPGLQATVLLGELAGARSPGRVHSPLVGVDVRLDAGTRTSIPLEPDFEHAIVGVTGSPEVGADADAGLAPGTLVYLGSNRRELHLYAETPSRFLLVGGVPFDEEIVMWWNFVGRSGAEIAEFRAQWEAELADVAGPQFGQVRGYEGTPLHAPQLPPTPLKARGRVPH